MPRHALSVDAELFDGDRNRRIREPSARRSHCEPQSAGEFRVLEVRNRREHVHNADSGDRNAQGTHNAPRLVARRGVG